MKRVPSSRCCADPALAGRFARLPAAPGARYFLEKKLREEALCRAQQAGKAAAQRFVAALRESGVGVQVLKPRAANPGRSPLFLKLALLVGRGKVIGLLGEAERSAAASDLLMIEPTGPLPPYHFCPTLGAPAA